MFQEPNRLLIHQLCDHVREDSSYGIESLVCLADILKSHIVEQYLLNDEDSNRLAELRTCLHNTEAQGNDLGSEVGAVVLDKRANHPKRGKSKIFEGSRFGGRVEEGVKEEGNVCCLALTLAMSSKQSPEWKHTSKEETTGLMM